MVLHSWVNTKAKIRTELFCFQSSLSFVTIMTSALRKRTVFQSGTCCPSGMESPTVPDAQALIAIIKHRVYRRQLTSPFPISAMGASLMMGLGWIFTAWSWLYWPRKSVAPPCGPCISSTLSCRLDTKTILWHPHSCSTSNFSPMVPTLTSVFLNKALPGNTILQPWRQTSGHTELGYSDYVC